MCVTNQKLKTIDPPKYEEFIADHECMINHKGSAPLMEVEGAISIFNRSVEKHNLRYTEYYGDGYSKRFLKVKNVYPGIEVNKLEYTAHVQKRIGNR